MDLVAAATAADFKVGSPLFHSSSKVRCETDVCGILTCIPGKVLHTVLNSPGEICFFTLHVNSWWLGARAFCKPAHLCLTFWPIIYSKTCSRSVFCTLCSLSCANSSPISFGWCICWTLVFCSSWSQSGRSSLTTNIE